MNIIEDRNFRTKMRKLAKKRYDKMIDLAVSENSDEPIRARLLDEGAVTYADGTIMFYIAKGAIEKYYEALPDDYVGSINLGHMDFATFPILLGEWKKSDLHIVDIGDGRKALDVDVRLDDSLSIVQDLKKQSFSVGLSAEFTVNENLSMTEEVSKKLGRYVSVYDNIFIGNFAVVGECGNVNSSDELDLKGGELMFIDKIKSLVTDEHETEELAVEEASVEEVIEEAVEESPGEEEQVETLAVETEAEEEEIDLAVPENNNDEVLETIRSIQAENAALRETVARMQETLSTYEQNARDFESKFKSLVVEFAKPEKEETLEVSVPIRTDGIGEF